MLELKLVRKQYYYYKNEMVKNDCKCDNNNNK